jgi:spore coat protein U-like protein
MRTALLACALTGAMFATSAHAAQSTGQLDVSATVNASCVVVGAGTMNFGNYDPAGLHNTAPRDATGSFSVRCTKGTTAQIWLGEGLNPATGSNCGTPLRQMASGTNRLGYQLYGNSTRTSVWGCQASAQFPYASTSANTTTPMTVWGRIPGGQDVDPATDYADTVVITLNF